MAADRSTAVRPRAPTGTRVYAIGDIHGRLDLLRELHRQILDDAARHPATRRVLVHLGDYVDRGHESAGVIDELLDHPLPGFEIVNLLGNHEDSMMRFLDDLSVGPAWLYYGGIATLASYEIEARGQPWRDERELRRLQVELRQRLPERHLRFMQSLPLHHGEGDYLFVHAGLRPGIPLARQAREDLLWIRDEFLFSPLDHGKIVVHGHTITDMPELQSNRIGIDTGAFATGRLTCLVLDGEARAFLAT
jgi:serine/threonine protein phosphatase 1